ncbi:ferredoxin [Myxococcaceae bacterium]|jgi:adenylate cyclase|nr:ferredoxin [Myxococcaceae bacterium]
MLAKVRFEPSGRAVEVAPGTSLLDAARQAGLPVARACGAGGICGRCGLRVIAGGERLEPPSETEIVTRRRNRVSEELRLACRVAVAGDLVVTASYW